MQSDVLLITAEDPHWHIIVQTFLVIYVLKQRNRVLSHQNGATKKVCVCVWWECGGGGLREQRIKGIEERQSMGELEREKSKLLTGMTRSPLRTRHTSVTREIWWVEGAERTSHTLQKNTTNRIALILSA